MRLFPALERVAITLLSLTFLACASSQPVYRETVFLNKSYDTRQEITTDAGSPMISAQKGTLVYEKKWVGVDQYGMPCLLTFLDTDSVKDGWQEDERVEDVFKRELIYSGTDGSAINLLYREYNGGSARPSRIQWLKYDLANSPMIQFRDFQFEIIRANLSNITFKVLSEPADFMTIKGSLVSN
ncbi:MAG: hypothetical protein ABFD69_03335 [Candidatus Sumerlaeia bacterium]